jgi:hypothetical protein
VTCIPRCVVLPMVAREGNGRLFCGGCCGCQGCVEEVEVLAGLEADGFAGDDADLGAGAGVATDAGLAGLDGEDTEAAQLDAVSGDHALLHAVEHGVDGGLGLGSWQAGAFDDLLNQILFDHGGRPSLGSQSVVMDECRLCVPSVLRGGRLL